MDNFPNLSRQPKVSPKTRAALDIIGQHVNERNLEYVAGLCLKGDINKLLGNPATRMIINRNIK